MLKMEENKQHFWCIMLCHSKKGKNTTEIQKKICAVYGESAVTDQMCQKWFVKFPCWTMLRSRVAVEVDSDPPKTLIEDNQQRARWERAAVPKISKPIKSLGKMNNVSLVLWKKLNGLFGQPNIYPWVQMWVLA